MHSIAQLRTCTRMLIEQLFDLRREKSPRDWKSRRRQKRLEGSNPSFSARMLASVMASSFLKTPVQEAAPGF